MLATTSLTSRRRGRRRRIMLMALLAMAFLGATAAEAGATLRVVNHVDPAGDPTVIKYQLQFPPPDPAIEFNLVNGEYKSFGVKSGTYTVQALPPAGWQVADIQCAGLTPANFAIDVPNGRVTIVHGQAAEDTCSFTNRRATPSTGGGGTPPSSVSPSPPAEELSKGVVLPRGPALVRVSAGLRFAAATVRITQRSVIKAQLLWHKTRVVGSARVAHKPGTHVVKVALKKKYLRRFRRNGLKRITLALRVVVRGANGATKVFRYGVVVRL
jgi:hypothetical protein